MAKADFHIGCAKPLCEKCISFTEPFLFARDLFSLSGFYEKASMGSGAETSFLFLIVRLLSAIFCRQRAGYLQFRDGLAPRVGAWIESCDNSGVGTC
jgi:hypothetical protein